MHIETFDSHEEMVTFLAERAREAHDGLAVAQQGLTWGSTWVQFYDVKRRHVVFGRVSTYEEVYLAESEFPELVLLDTERRLADGLMYGHAADKFNIAGEFGHTHKAHAWPIEDHVYAAAKAVDWDIDRLEVGHQLALNIAFVQWRDHVRSAA